MFKHALAETQKLEILRIARQFDKGKRIDIVAAETALLAAATFIAAKEGPREIAERLYWLADEYAAQVTELGWSPK